jgi:anhydro-N-acetylmuramic acid kinase
VTAPLYVGAISGTSVDGLDLSLLEATNPPTILAGRTVQIPSDLSRLLKSLGSGEVAGLDQFGDADHRLGALIGNSIVEFLADLSLTADRITAIGSHGQTVRHRPDAPAPFSVQIGDPNLIAEITGIDTIADFRRRDMAAGGQGAPLVPPFHEALFRTPEENRTVLNIGGIANISYLPSDPNAPIIGFDTGPGNAMLDAWVERHTGAPYDRDGAWAQTGSINHDLLARLLTDAFFDVEPPKSTGKELFNLAWLARRDVELPRRNPADVQATLAELTANSIAQAISRWAPTTDRLIVCGGGRLNRHLMQRLGVCVAPILVVPTESFNYGGDWVEAAAFAWLAHRTMIGQAGSDRAITGARSSRVLGGFYPKSY